MSLLERITGAEAVTNSADDHTASSIFAEIFTVRHAFEQFLEDTDSVG